MFVVLDSLKTATFSDSDSAKTLSYVCRTDVTVSATCKCRKILANEQTLREILPAQYSKKQILRN